MFPRALVLRFFYRHGFPFIASLVLATVTAARPHFCEAHFHEDTSIWTFAILVTISTAFALLFGGRFRTFFIATAVMPPFLLVVPGWVLSAISHPDYPIKCLVECFLYVVATPITLVWTYAKLLNRRERRS